MIFSTSALLNRYVEAFFRSNNQGRPEQQSIVGGPQICKLAFFLDLRNFRKCGNLQFCGPYVFYYLRIRDYLWTQLVFEDWRHPQSAIFIHTNISLKCSHSNIRMTFGFLEIYEFAICGLAHLRNLRTCDFGMSKRICGYAICELSRTLCLPTFDNKQIVSKRIELQPAFVEKQLRHTW
jgi:hypothetical protein